jgi:hypothetical protein
VRLNTAGTLNIYCGNGANTTDTLSDNTEYHIWAYYKAGSGSNAECWVEFTAEATRTPVGSGNKYASVSNGTATADAAKLQLLENVSDVSYYDQVLLDDEAIGTVCE